jgi:hypothetical protein
MKMMDTIVHCNKGGYASVRCCIMICSSPRRAEHTKEKKSSVALARVRKVLKPSGTPVRFSTDLDTKSNVFFLIVYIHRFSHTERSMSQE